MASICARKDQLIQNPSELDDQEVYYSPHSIDKQFYINISDVFLLKQSSDRCTYKRPLKTIESYADYYEHKIPNIRIERDLVMSTMKPAGKPRINYLKDSIAKKESRPSSTKLDYFPVEVLRYAPLNQTDFELIYKLPSIFIRISQLYRIVQLGKRFADNIQSCSVQSKILKI